MTSGKDTLLGRQTPVPDTYCPGILQGMPRAAGRAALGMGENPGFYGVDLWHAYELSWLDDTGKPEVRVGQFNVPADSPNMIESKSLKLYLNSLNGTRFDSEDKYRETVIADLSAVAGAGITFELLSLEDPLLSGTTVPGKRLDNVKAEPPGGQPSADLLETRGAVVDEQVYTHLLRSLCPVTGQPDWATLWLHYKGEGLEHASLLNYVISYREHREFHEQCVERIFRDIQQCIAPEFLHVQAFYTRRGGLDINPFRSTDPDARPLPRTARQ